jgi:HTH-type transcriptional regulator / antitoxin HipB
MTMGKKWEDIKRERRGTAASAAAVGQGRADAREAFLLGERICEARERVGLTQKEFADRVGTSQSAVARAESGGVVPSLNSLQRYAAALDMRVTIGLDPIGRTSPRAFEVST